MNQTYLKIPSLLLACAFLLGMLPAAFAAEIPEETANTEPEVSTAPTEETTTPEEKKWRQSPLLHWKLHRSLRMGSLSLQRMFPPIWKQQRMLAARRHL